GLIARAGADLEDVLLARELERLAHARHGRGRRDRLALADRQRVVAVGLRLQPLRHQPVARNRLERGEDARVANAGPRQALDHAPARTAHLRRRADGADPPSSPRRGRVDASWDLRQERAVRGWIHWFVAVVFDWCGALPVWYKRGSARSSEP